MVQKLMSIFPVLNLIALTALFKGGYSPKSSVKTGVIRSLEVALMAKRVLTPLP